MTSKKLLAAVLEVVGKVVLRPLGVLARLPRRLLAFFGLHLALRGRAVYPPRVLVIGGFGYGNTGDEGQLGANLTRWRAQKPSVDVTVLSPHPGYTADHHGCRSEAASRDVIFRSNETSDYNTTSHWFRLTFLLVLLRMEINARLMAAGLSPILASADEAKLLFGLQSAAVVHVSGGGFMTGPTRSRLWDTCLVLRLCQRLGTPFFLTGQTLGIFQTPVDRWLARTALRGALGISLRDPGKSEDELISLGVPETLLTNSYDDALFCDTASDEEVARVLADSGLKPSQRYVAVNYHWWGMDAATRAASAVRLAEICDHMSTRYGYTPLFVAMVPTDTEALEAVAGHMARDSVILQYDYSYRVVRGVIAGAELLMSFKHHPLIFALGEAVPCLSISFDSYYHRKNFGAMANLGQGRFCADREAFEGPDMDKLISELAAESAEISLALEQSLAGAREKQDAFFAECVRKAGIDVSSPDA